MGITLLPAPVPPSRDIPYSFDTSVPISPQQHAIREWVRYGEGSAFVEAVAGSGKSHALLAAAREMRGDVALTSFNKAIAVELETKIKRMGLRNVRVGTFHRFGLGAWTRYVPDPSALKVDASAKNRLMLDTLGVVPSMRVAISRLVSIAKQSGVMAVWDEGDMERWNTLIDHFDIMSRVEDDRGYRGGRDDRGGGVGQTADDDGYDKLRTTVIELGRQGVAWARGVANELVDFDDMLWMPLVENAPMNQHDWVVVDEAQDTNLVRRLLAEKMVKAAPWGRTLWCGDRNQAIYGFNGSDANAIDSIVEHFDCQPMPLTVTFRCSKAATAMAQQFVPRITAYEENRQGGVLQLPYDIYFKDCMGVKAAGPGDVVLCRYTKPLVELAFSLLRTGKGCHVEGRDIGKGLEHLIDKWKVVRVSDLVSRLLSYRERETAKLRERAATMKLSGVSGLIAALQDKVDTALILCDGVDLVSEVKDRIAAMFEDTVGDGDKSASSRLLTLCTVHRFKGREADRVFILGYEQYMPSQWAKQDWELAQEDNLRYVAVTRTRDVLVLTPGPPTKANGKW